MGRAVTYAGDDVAAFEGQMASFGPAWLAYDMRLMMAGIQKFGMRSGEDAVERLQAILGRPLRTYANFVKETVTKAWWPHVVAHARAYHEINPVEAPPR